MNFAGILASGRRDFLEAIRDISPEQASHKPSPRRWSVLDCVEHMAAVEERYLDWLSQGSADPPPRDSDRELRLFSIVRSRLIHIEAVDVVRPCGRFENLSAARVAFEAVRGRSEDFARERGLALYSIGATHPYFGILNGAEWIQLIDAHARRHADQIRELRDEWIPPDHSTSMQSP